MATGVNRVILVGRLGKDPEVRYTGSGAAVCSFSLATSKSWKDKDGNKQDKTEWHRIVAWGKTAELCGQYLNKGSQAYIEGEIESRSYKDKQDVERYVTEIKAQTVQFLSPKNESRGGGQGGGYVAAESRNQRPQSQDMGYEEAPSFQDQDIPF